MRPGKRLDIGPLDGVTRAVSKTASGSASQRWKLFLTAASVSQAVALAATPSALTAREELATYPNPFSTEATISFPVPARASWPPSRFTASRASWCAPLTCPAMPSAASSSPARIWRPAFTCTAWSWTAIP
ncbi:MAG: hypothetical protein WKG07_09405 [Hymenobacter sp.]